MDDISHNSVSTGSEQNGSNTKPNMYGQYGEYGQRTQYGQYGGYGQRPDPLEDNHPVIPVKQKKKISLPIIIILIVVLVAFVIGCFTLGPAYSAARKYGKAIADGDDADKIAAMVFPEDYLKKTGVNYDAYTANLNTALSALQCAGDIKFKGVTLGSKIKSGDLNDIESYYDFIFKALDYRKVVKIEKGYEIKLKFKAGGSNQPYDCCVIKMKGEGWKIFPLPVDELSAIMSTIRMIESMNLEY